MIKDMMDKYKDADEEDEVCEVRQEVKQVKTKAQEIAMDDQTHDVQRDICLPSIKDSKLWRIKVTPGRERELVIKITNKLIDYLNNGDPLNVLEVFECQLS